MEKTIHALNKLKKYIEDENYRGWDPYDTLSSRLFNLPFFRSNTFLRFTAQQAGKRFPLNLRSLLFVPKRVNPVTLGLCLQGCSYLIQNSEFRDQREALENKIELLVSELIKAKSSGFAGACWGYDFDWEARDARIDAYQPTVVATGIIINALFICCKITGNVKARELVIDSAKFVLNDLNRSYPEASPSDVFFNRRKSPDQENSPFCFSYSPFDHQKVLNASMKGVRILSQAYSLSSREEMKNIASKAVEFVVTRQKADGSWAYSDKKTEHVDSYHTGYILDSLDDYIILMKDENYKGSLEKGISYYVNTFIENEKIPKFFNNRRFPIDCTAAGQLILSLNRFGYKELARNIAEYMIDLMQDKKGFFYFRKFRSYTIKTSYMRWSNAWMFAALSYLLTERKTS